MDFIKMHGCGNDYIFIDCIKQPQPKSPESLAISLSNRHYGIGSDGLVLILPSDIADCRMDIYNRDGSKARMCGNAIRCIGKFLFEEKYTDSLHITIDTESGIKDLDLTYNNGFITSVRVNMGNPNFSSCSLPMSTSLPYFINEPILINDDIYYATCLSMGNPHIVVFGGEIHIVGPSLLKNPLFPYGVNVSCVKSIDNSTIHVNIYERGSGLTLGCGTGACASAVACMINGYVKNKAFVNLPGGTLLVEYDKSLNLVYLTGDAVTVFRGTISL